MTITPDADLPICIVFLVIHEVKKVIGEGLKSAGGEGCYKYYTVPHGYREHLIMVTNAGRKSGKLKKQKCLMGLMFSIIYLSGHAHRLETVITMQL
jgi:hypothetical protein